MEQPYRTPIHQTDNQPTHQQFYWGYLEARKAILGQASVLRSKHRKDLSDSCLPYPVAVPETHKVHHRTCHLNSARLSVQFTAHTRLYNMGHAWFSIFLTLRVMVIMQMFDDVNYLPMAN